MVSKSPQKFKKPVWLSDPNRCGSGKNTGKKCVKARIPKCIGCPLRCTKWVSKPKLCGKTPKNHPNKSIRKSPASKRSKRSRKSRGRKSHGRKSHGRKLHGRKSRGRKSHGRKSHGRKLHGRKSHGRKSRGRKSRGRK